MTKLKIFLQMVDFGHTLFGLPFAYLGAFLAAGGVPSLHHLVWITLAMVSARTAALCLNRLIDRKIDQLNPRTSHWALAAGKLSIKKTWIAVLIFLILLFYSAAQLNKLCLQLAPLAVVILWIYSYTKRFTWWCHLILGIAIGAGTVGAWIAVTGVFDWQPLILGMAVACWIAGFDTMYACQDIDFDRQEKLFSIPARFGEKGALIFSAGFHLVTIILFIINGIILNLGYWYYAGVVFATIILIYEHIIVRPGDLSRVNLASFKINRYVGFIMFTTTIIDIMV
ncbi:MAG: putative 4-hydroxybenzoate polyprenyltransferase [Syntrophomonadaceae bacterium]|nr:putative 4-hydroxybenzoate polyprenyltransferase [Syntrophomonadaceae bacterium]MDD3888451.1 putative 4-hydroxybenzoate polyprenyltransferase [Syntrophomonadaceae bacterium]MDD4549204.1 putative 4-hydroxybenzoate polyprenyltransferase [Syntrophomonadaceae bacterium]